MHVSYLCQSDFARRVGVAEVTVRRWIRRGRLQYVQLPSGERRIPSTEVDKILMERSDAPPNS